MVGGRVNPEGRDILPRQANEQKPPPSLQKPESHGGNHPCQGALRCVFYEAKESGKFSGTIATLVGCMTRSGSSAEEMDVAKKALEVTLASSSNYATAITELVAAGDGNPIVRNFLTAHISARVGSGWASAGLSSLASSCDESTLKEVIKAAADSRNSMLLGFVISASKRCNHPIGAWQVPKLATTENQDEVNRFLKEETSKLDEKARRKILDAANREFGERGLHLFSQDMAPANGNIRLDGTREISTPLKRDIPQVFEASRPFDRYGKAVETVTFELVPDRNSSPYSTNGGVRNDSSAMFDMFFRLKRISVSEPVLNKRKRKTEILAPEESHEYRKTDKIGGASEAYRRLAGITNKTIEVPSKITGVNVDSNLVRKSACGKGVVPSIPPKIESFYHALKEKAGIGTPPNNGGMKASGLPKLETSKHAEVHMKRIKNQVPIPYRQRKSGAKTDLNIFRRIDVKKPRILKKPSSPAQGVLLKNGARKGDVAMEPGTRKKLREALISTKGKENGKGERSAVKKKHGHNTFQSTERKSSSNKVNTKRSSFLKSNVSKPRLNAPEKRIISERSQAHESNAKLGTRRKVSRNAGALARHNKRVKVLEKKEKKRKKISLLLLMKKRMRRKPKGGKFTFKYSQSK